MVVCYEELFWSTLHGLGPVLQAFDKLLFVAHENTMTYYDCDLDIRNFFRFSCVILHVRWFLL